MKVITVKDSARVWHDTAHKDDCPHYPEEVRPLRGDDERKGVMPCSYCAIESRVPEL